MTIPQITFDYLQDLADKIFLRVRSLIQLSDFNMDWVEERYHI